MGVKVAGA